MNTRPSPMKFKVTGFLLKGVDIAYNKLVHLNLQNTSLEEVLQIIRDAPLLEICYLSMVSRPIDGFHVPQTIIRLPYLQTFNLSLIKETEVFHKLINSLELPSMESWSVDLMGSSVGQVDEEMISFLKRFGCSLKTLCIRQDRAPAPAVEDFERFLQAAPSLQHLRVDCPSSPLMDSILERISTSPPQPTLQTGRAVGFLSDLQSLELTLIGSQFKNAWACIPLIFRWPHRKILNLDIRVTMYSVTIGDDVLGELAQLVDQGIKLRIYDILEQQDYLLTFREGATVESRN